MKPLLILEMNEVNFDYVQRYIEKGHLETFAKVIDQFGLQKTTSETEYEILEPWIQWVSARTGLTYREHGVFRLGDITSKELKQHWEALEERGYSVAAVSPINAANRTQNSACWIPDPWVDTPTSGPAELQAFAAAIRQAVNDNASEQLSSATKRTLARTMLLNTKPSSWLAYAMALVGALRKQHWSKAIILDRLIADVFFHHWRKSRPDFATLFLNSAAHIQHHYLYNSAVYEGDQRNPDWYIDADKDPVLEIYQLYDAILREALNLDVRLIVATGLTQVPYEASTFYYRLRDHHAFITKLCVDAGRVQTRMSRDFLMECDDRASAATCEEKLLDLTDSEGVPVFSVDNRGDSLFVTLSYPHEITPRFTLYSRDGRAAVQDFDKEVVFVAVKNGHHDSTGFCIDTDPGQDRAHPSIPLESLWQRVMDHFPAKASHQ